MLAKRYLHSDTVPGGLCLISSNDISSIPFCMGKKDHQCQWKLLLEETVIENRLHYAGIVSHDITHLLSGHSDMVWSKWACAAQWRSPRENQNYDNAVAKDLNIQIPFTGRWWRKLHNFENPGILTFPVFYLFGGIERYIYTFIIS